MTAVPIFIGPSWPALHAAPPPGFVVLPPARAGDVLALLRDPPPAIAIVDGVFETAPSLWHKEILLALDRGVQVFGAASLGALRAAELHTHGMIGVGSIFEAYRDGAIDRDDAVMVAHAPGELGYAPLTVALVDMVPTIAALGDALAPGGSALLTAIAHALFFKDRSWAELARRFAAQVGEEDGGRSLALRLAAAHVEAKRVDVARLIDTVTAWRRDPRPPPAPGTPPTPWLVSRATAHGLVL